MAEATPSVPFFFLPLCPCLSSPSPFAIPSPFLAVAKVEALSILRCQSSQLEPFQ